jgi:hypothetical protein
VEKTREWGREASGSGHSTAEDPEQLTDPQRATRHGHFAGRSDVLGMAWVLGAGLAILVPVFLHGWILGPFDLISRSGLTAQPGVPLHIYQNPDLIDSLIPWSDTVWQQVHAGHLPLWNPYGGLGMPLAFNWQSAPFSLPSLVGYLAPLRDAFTVGVVVNILVAGSGAYVLGRVLGMGAVASAAVGTVFELSGPMAAWLGYPFPAVMCWAGWIFAIGLLLLRGRQHRAGSVVALAACTALALYGGAPEGFAAFMTAAAVFFVVVLLCRTRWLGGSGEILRPAMDLVVGTIAGCALAAPFALPGLQLSSQSVRNHSSAVGTLKLHALTYLGIPAFDGLPIFHGGRVAIFGYTFYYGETAMYVGVSALVLGGLAVVLLRGRPEVRGFVVVVVLCLAVVFIRPVTSAAAKLPVLGSVSSLRALMPMALALAVLCGFGLDLVVRSSAPRKAGRWLGVGFGIAALVLLGIWLFGRGRLGPVDASVRAHSFIWPAVETLVGLATAAYLIRAGGVRRGDRAGVSGSDGPWIIRSPGTTAGIVVLAVLTAFLVSSGATMMQSSPSSFPQTRAAQAFVRTVGSATVGFGVAGFSCESAGFEPNVNDVYGVHEFDVYDPIIPKDYFSAWPADTGSAPGVASFNLFCPAVTSTSEAREFGVGYVLEPSGHPGPAGSAFVGRFEHEALYRIPGSGAATVAPLTHGELPADGVSGKPIPVQHASPSQWELKTSSGSPQALRLHLTDVPGWHASIDGKPLALEQYAGMMLQARIPAGDHTIALHYWPATFTYGIVLALCSALFLTSLLVISSRRRRNRAAPVTSEHEAPTRPVS